MHGNYKKANSAPRCTRILANERPCTQPALRGGRFCRFHDPVSKRNLRLDFPIIEDAPSLQFAIAEIVHALTSGKMKKETAEVALQGIRLAAANMKDFHAEMRRAEREEV